MLKTRRQRSFWARIKLSIILFQTPQRASDFNNFKQVPFLILGTLTLIEKTCIKQLYITSHISSLILCSTLIFLTKDFCSLAFLLSLPFNFKDQFAYSTLLRSAASEKECITKPFILSSIFFLFFFFSVLKLKPSQTLQTKKNIKALL